MTPQQALEQYFGYENFRSNQLEIITSILEKKDTVVTMPTGGGKSICFQVPGLLLSGITLVITPLISLMKDQVETLRKKGITATCISSVQAKSEQEKILQKIKSNHYKFIYISPERLENVYFQKILSTLNISQLVIDEAHCIYQWGEEFRPSYKRIADNFRDRSDIVITAFTATATPRVLDSIITTLKLRDPQFFSATSFKENIQINVFKVDTSFEQRLALVEILLHHRNQKGVVYVSTRVAAEELYELLTLWNFRLKLDSGFYHGGMSALERDAVQSQFQTGQIKILVATNAFGMGIDIPNIRYVVHYQVPNSIENYTQEIGRVGRDNKECYSYLIFNNDTVSIQKNFINSIKNVAEIRKAVTLLKNLLSYIDSATCRAFFLHSYFDASINPYCCLVCDNCKRNKNTKKINKKYVDRLLCIKEHVTKVAIKNKVKPEVILTPQCLSYVALLQPRTETEYLSIPGIGTGWIKKWFTTINEY